MKKLLNILCITLAVILSVPLFSGCSPKESPVEDFEYTVGDYYIQITKYIGKDKDVVIPRVIEGRPVTSLGGYAFYKTDIESVIIPDTVTFIFSAFFQCESLKKVVIPDSVTIIEGSAFLGCTSLSDVKLPKNILYVGESAFASTAITELSIPKYANLDSGAFSKNNSLKTIIFEEGCENIGGAFKEFSACESLEKVIIPSTAKQFAFDAFSRCPNLKSFEFAGNAPEKTGTHILFSEEDYLFFKDFDFKSITVYYNKGTTGWDAEFWQDFTLVER